MEDLLIRTAELLLPAPGVDPTAWACVACDQFTSQPEYWEEAARLVGDRPSALRCVLPECYLSEAAQRVPEIHSAMRRYLTDGALTPGVRDGFILTERNTGSGTRVGLVLTIDLEAYDYRPGSQSPIRPTEGTITDRIPPRLAVRRGAPLELSHVLLLIDDPMQSVAEPLMEKRDQLHKLYDFPLMLEGGHLVGYAVEDPADIAAVRAALAQLKGRSNPLYAVGDGNHSLATAKAYWEELKPALTEAERADHPARFAMVELENIHDDALIFEPIHRVLYGYDGDALLDELARYAAARGWSLAGDPDAQEIDVVFEGKRVQLSVSGSPYPLAVGTLQAFLDEWVPAHPGTRVDYIHGSDAVQALTAGERAVGFLLPALDKAALFPAVEKLGALPRKTFSLGAAREKRYYMEARRITRA